MHPDTAASGTAASGTALDPARAEVRVEFGLARAELAQRSARRAVAEQYAAIEATLAEARAFPEVFLGPYSSADRAQSSPAAERSATAERSALAERAAVADLAVRLGLAEQTVREQDYHARILLTRTPRVWRAFREGAVSVPNARAVADAVASLPDAALEAHRAFDEAALALAGGLAPARLRPRLRALRERLHPEPLTRRHEVRMQERGVWIEPSGDGMSWLSAYLPAEVAQQAVARLDRIALALAAHPDEVRTLGQLRADALGDLLTGRGSPAGVGVSVAVTVPVLTLLGHEEAPGVLEGYGPIDADTARRLAAHAPSFSRLLTHPVTGAVLDLDRRSYRVPADLRRWLALRDGGCTFPGCGRRPGACDLDHTIAWADGGETSAANLAHLCRHHHRLKHESRWRVERPDDGPPRWTSPTGAHRRADPPPF